VGSFDGEDGRGGAKGISLAFLGLRDDQDHSMFLYVYIATWILQHGLVQLYLKLSLNKLYSISPTLKPKQVVDLRQLPPLDLYLFTRSKLSFTPHPSFNSSPTSSKPNPIVSG